jgi:hypothetical protein
MNLIFVRFSLTSKINKKKVVYRYLLNFNMADVALLLVLISPVEMFDVHMLLQLLIRHKLLLAQMAHRPMVKHVLWLQISSTDFSAVFICFQQ